MNERSPGTQRSRKPASEPGARHERSPAPIGEVPTILQLGTTLGNRTTTTLLAGGLLQRKVAIGPADDPLEREADRVAERVLAQPDSAVESISSAGAAIQRKCAACAAGGQSCAECEKEDEELRRQETGQPAGGPAPAQVDSHLATLGPGRPLPNDLRSYLEPRFDHGFGDVRLHTGSAADAAARAANARAFTLRQDVVFAAGQYSPATRGGRRLLAHELAHVVQQAPTAVRRQASDSEMPTSGTSAPPAAEAETTVEPAPQEDKTEAAEPRRGEAPKGLIVADEAEPGTGQMTRSAFLDELHTAACTAAEEGLAGTGRDAQGCPWIERYFQLYRGMSAERLEGDLLRYVPATRGATTARDYIAPTAEHIHNSVKRWAETGELTGVPEGLPGMGLLGAIGGSLAGIGRMLFKERSGGARGAAQPAAVASRLGEGSPLSGSVRSRMERGLGTGLGSVRLHTDATAARLASRHNARAFTVGRHVAFDQGQYCPGTPVGDALLAHELAHTLQQRSGASMAGGGVPPSSAAPLETAADDAALHAVASLWAPPQLGPHPRPRARRWGAARLSLQRCQPAPRRPATAYGRYLLEGTEKLKGIGFGVQWNPERGCDSRPVHPDTKQEVAGFDEDFWIKPAGACRLEPRPGVTPAQAIRALFDPKRKERWVLDCGQFVQLPHFYASLMTMADAAGGNQEMGDRQFNEQFANLDLRQLASRGLRTKAIWGRGGPNEPMQEYEIDASGSGGRKRGTGAESEAVPKADGRRLPIEQVLAMAPVGSRVEFTNPNILKKDHEGFQYENTMKADEGLYAAHPFTRLRGFETTNVLTEKQIVEELEEANEYEGGRPIYISEIEFYDRQ